MKTRLRSKLPVAIGVAFFSVVVLVVVLILVLVHAPGVVPRPEAGPRDSFSSTELSQLREGDVILRKGVGAVSEMIVMLLGDGLGVSHAAVVAKDPATGGLEVIETLNGTLTGVDGTQSQTLEDFNRYSSPDTLAVVRPLADAATIAAIVAAARRHLAARTPFDNEYDLTDRKALYCSEFLMVIFEEAGWMDKDYVMSGPVLSFRTFLDPDHFKLVMSHNPLITDTQNVKFVLPGTDGVDLGTKK